MEHILYIEEPDNSRKGQLVGKGYVADIAPRRRVRDSQIVYHEQTALTDGREGEFERSWLE